MDTSPWLELLLGIWLSYTLPKFVVFLFRPGQLEVSVHPSPNLGDDSEWILERPAIISVLGRHEDYECSRYC